MCAITTNSWQRKDYMEKKKKFRHIVHNIQVMHSHTLERQGQCIT
jgi:hypothetical protein